MKKEGNKCTTKKYKLKAYYPDIYSVLRNVLVGFERLKFVFSKKAIRIDEIFTIDLTLAIHNVKATVKIWSIFEAFLDNMNFNSISRAYNS